MSTLARPSLVDDTAASLAELLHAQACWFEPFPFDAQLPRIEPGRIVLPAAEPGLRSWSTDAVEIPVRFGDLLLGRFVMIPAAPTCGVAFPAGDRARAIEIAAGVGASLAAALRVSFPAP